MNLRIIVLILAFIIIVASAFAEVPAALTVTPSNETSVFTVFFKSVETGKVKLSIYNSAGQLVFKEVINNVASFKRPYNFSELTEGEYTLLLEDKNGRHEEKIKHHAQQVTSFIRINEVANEEHKYLLNIVNNGTEKVTIKIYDNVKGLMHEQQVQVTGSYGLIFNLNKVVSSSKAIILFEVSTSSGNVTTAMF